MEQNIIHTYNIYALLVYLMDVNTKLLFIDLYFPCKFDLKEYTFTCDSYNLIFSKQQGQHQVSRFGKFI